MVEENNASFSHQQRHDLYIIVAVQSIIGIILNIFTVFTYFRFKDLRKRSYELVFILAVSTILANTSYIMRPGNVSVDELCIIQGFAQNCFPLSMICWTTWIAYCLYRAVVLQLPSPSMKLMHAVTWSISVTLSIIPLFTESYVNVGPWCWISGSSTAGKIQRFVCFYLPLWFAFAVNFVLYFQSSSTLKRYALMTDLGSRSTSTNQNPSTTSMNEQVVRKDSSRETDDMTVNRSTFNNANTTTGYSAESDRLMKMANHLQWYPLIFVVSWTVNTVVRIVQAIYPTYDNLYVFSLIQVIGNGTFYQSVGNVFAYGLNTLVREKWSELVHSMRTKRSCMPLCFPDTNKDLQRESELLEVGTSN